MALVAWAARRVGRPVKWLCDRRDAFATDFHGRDLTSEAELALDKDGRFLAIRATNTSNLGASAISFVPLAKGIAVSSSVYDIACSYMRGCAVVTNLDLSTLVPGGLVPDRSDRAISGRAAADLMGSWLRYDPKLVGKHRWSQRLPIRWLE